MSTIYYESDSTLYHYGVKGMKWGVRHRHDTGGSSGSFPSRLSVLDTDSSVTKRVKKDYNNLSDQDFRRKYSASKKTYAKRVQKYGDPYKKSPLAKTANALKKRQDSKKYNKDYSSHQRTKDFWTVGATGTKHINKAMNKGKTHSQAYKTEVGRQVASGLMVGLAINIASNPTSRARVQRIGRTATEAILKAMGHTDIRWVD